MKKIWKRICALALALTMVLGLTWMGETEPVVAKAAEGDVIASGTDGANWEIKEKADGTYKLSITANAEDAENGTAVLNHNAEKPGKNNPKWYEYMPEISEVWVAKEITVLGNQAFWGCRKLTQVTFEEGSKLTKVGNGTFRNCVSLEELYFGDKLKTIGNNTFTSCYNLKVIDFGKGNAKGVSIGNTTLKFCSNLETVYLPEVLSKVGSNTFYQCHVLKNIYWYGTSLEAYNAMLTNADVDCDYLAELGMNLYLWDDSLNEGAGGWTSEPVQPGVTVLDNDVTAYRDYALASAPLLLYGDGTGSGVVDNYTIPADVTTLVVMENIAGFGSDVFAEAAVSSVIYYGTEEQWAAVSGKEALAGVAVECRKTGVAGDAVSYALTSEDNGATYKLTISGSGDMADDMTATNQPWWHVRHFITSVEIEDGVTSIGAYAFDKLRHMDELTIAGSVTMVNTYALRGCISLKEVTFQEGLENIGCGVFSGTVSLEKVNLPSTLRTVDMKAFEYCTGLKYATYNGYEYQWDNVAIDMSSDLNGYLVNADITFLPTPDITVYADSAASEYVDILQFMYSRLLINAAYEDAFGADLVLTDEEILNILYVWAGADSRYENALDWAKSNALVAEEYEYGVMTETKLNTLLAAVAAYNGYEMSVGEGTDEQLTREKGLAILGAFLQQEEGTADRYAKIVSVLKNAIENGGDGKMHVIAPNIFVENLGKKVGDCTFLVFPDGQTMLIDSGLGVGTQEDDDGNVSDTGKALITFLYDIGLTRLDYMVLSHGHGDHYGGMESVAKYIYGEHTEYATVPGTGSVGAFWIPGTDAEGGVYYDTTGPVTESYLRTKNVPVTYMNVAENGSSFDIAIGDVTLTIFGPTLEDIATVRGGSTGDEQVNNTSICMKFTYGESSFMACGDTYISQENELVDAFAGTDFLKVDVMKANHHGNYQSSGQKWIDATQPKVFIAEIDGTGSGVVSTIVNNAGGTYYTTGFDGAVLVTMEKDGTYTVNTQYDGVLRKQSVAPVDLLSITVTETVTDAETGTVTTTEEVIDLATGKATETTITVTQTDAEGKETITTTVLDAEGNVVSVEVSGDGIKGEDGEDGQDGADGKDGQNGADGKDGQDGADGKDGQDGVDGKDGQDGQDGADGKDGQDGKDGVDGQDGKDGAQGSKGDKGDTGAAGADGKAGVDGQDGKDGVDGQNGKDGADGKDGKDGVGIADVKIDENGNLIVTLTDGSVIDAGKLPEAAAPTAASQSNGGGTSLSILAIVISLAALAWSVFSSAKKNAKK